MNTQPYRHIALLSLLGFTLGLLLAARPAEAQTDRPGLLTEEIQRHFGSRQVLPFSAPVGPDGIVNGSARVRVTNTGWKSTQVLVVELSREALDCATGFAAERVLAVHCRNDLPRFASTEIPLSGQDSLVYVYSLDPALAADACAAFAPVRRGETSLPAWETSVQRRAAGEPLSVLGTAATPKLQAAMPALAGLAIPANTASAIMASKALAHIAKDASPARLRLVNGSSECLRLVSRVGQASEGADCRPPAPMQAELGATGALDIRPQLGGADAGALNVLPGARQSGDSLQLSAAIDQQGEDLWLRHAASTLSSADSRILSFPLALSPLPESSTELWITNAHVTATIQVSLVMSDGNAQVLRNYNDPVGLCPGATRVYDILDLAGEIPPTGRGGNGSAYLSLRAEGLSAELGEFAPIAGTLIMRSPAGSFAYPGLNVSFEASALRPRRDQTAGDHAIAAVLPGLKLRHGPQRMTSFVAIAGLGGNPGDNLVTIDFYDESGTRLVSGFQRSIRPVGFFDLSQVVLRPTDGAGEAQRLPDGFVGTAVIRGQRNPGALFGAVAVERPATGDRGDAATGPIHAYTSQALRLWPNPDAPSPTPPPTLARPSATPERPPTDEPTPSPQSDKHRIWLPLLQHGTP